MFRSNDQKEIALFKKVFGEDPSCTIAYCGSANSIVSNYKKSWPLSNQPEMPQTLLGRGLRLHAQKLIPL